jgi:hypothetical protein
MPGCDLLDSTWARYSWRSRRRQGCLACCALVGVSIAISILVSEPANQNFLAVRFCLRGQVAVLLSGDFEPGASLRLRTDFERISMRNILDKKAYPTQLLISPHGTYSTSLRAPTLSSALPCQSFNRRGSEQTNSIAN